MQFLLIQTMDHSIEVRDSFEDQTDGDIVLLRNIYFPGFKTFMFFFIVTVRLRLLGLKYGLHKILFFSVTSSS